MKKLLCFIIISCLAFNGTVLGVPTNSISITNPTDGTVISAEDESTRYNEITTKYGAHSHTDILTDFTDNTLTIGDGAAGNKNYAVDTDNAGNPTLRFSTTTESWQVSTSAGTFPGNLIVSGIVDLDQDTGIFIEKTSDEDKIRFQISGTEIAVFADGTDDELSVFTNPGTNHAVSVQQTGVLAASKRTVYVYSNAAQISSGARLLAVINDNASSTVSASYFQHDGINAAFQIDATNSDGAHLSLTGDPTNDSTPLDGDVWFDGTDISLYVTDTAYTLDKSSVSDERVKQNIKDTTISLNDLLDIKIKDFKFKKKYGNDSKEHTGILAQSLLTKYPYAVEPVKIPKLGNGYKVNYKKLVPLLIKSVQELNTEIEGLKARILVLEGHH